MMVILLKSLVTTGPQVTCIRTKSGQEHVHTIGATQHSYSLEYTQPFYVKTGPAYHQISFGAANILSCSENEFVHIIGAAYASGTVRTWNYDTGEILSTIRYIHTQYVRITYIRTTHKGAYV